MTLFRWRVQDLFLLEENNVDLWSVPSKIDDVPHPTNVVFAPADTKYVSEAPRKPTRNKGN